jgi:hypothetical protein
MKAIESAFFRVRLFMAVALNMAVHGAGDVLFLTPEEADAHGHKLEALTADQAAALGVSQHTAANIVATVQGLPSDAVVKGLQLGTIHEDTARAAFPDAFAKPVDPSKDESAAGATVEAAVAPSPVAAEAATPAAPDSNTTPAASDAQSA